LSHQNNFLIFTYCFCLSYHPINKLFVLILISIADYCITYVRFKWFVTLSKKAKYNFFCFLGIFRLFFCFPVMEWYIFISILSAIFWLIFEMFLSSSEGFVYWGFRVRWYFGFGKKNILHLLGDPLIYIISYLRFCICVTLQFHQHLRSFKSFILYTFSLSKEWIWFFCLCDIFKKASYEMVLKLISNVTLVTC